jgi:hypothetical protein
MSITLFITLTRLISPDVTTQEIVKLSNFLSRPDCESIAKEVKKLEWAELTIQTKCVADA